MSITGILVSLVGLAALVLFISAPFLERAKSDGTSAAPPIDPIHELNAAYARIKSTLRDLDEDHALGKLDDEAYRTERDYWLTEGARVLAAIDQARPQPD